MGPQSRSCSGTAARSLASLDWSWRQFGLDSIKSTPRPAVLGPLDPKGLTSVGLSMEIKWNPIDGAAVLGLGSSRRSG